MSRLKGSGIILILQVVLSVIAVAGEAVRPNIILILCDDLGYADVGFNGSADIRTPHLDSLAVGGTVLSSAYVAHPFCGPSRMALMTGRYPHEFGAPFNLPNSGHGIEKFNRKGIPESEVLMSKVIQDAGYFTGAIGKWHMGIDPKFHPNARGFDEFYGFLGGGHRYFPSDFKQMYEDEKRKGTRFINEYLLPLERNGEEVEEKEYLTDGLSREAVGFVRNAASLDRPFFLYLAYNAPHSPLEARQEDLAHYADIEDDKRRIYAAMVHAVDRGIGRIVETLKSSDVFEDTLIVFLSDNGGKLSLGASNGPLAEGKGSTHEGGIRVPMLFHWPGKVPAGRRYEHPVSSLDLYPTFADLAGATIPSGKHIDGKNVWAEFIAGESPRKGGMIYALRHREGYSDVGARMDHWKITRVGKGGWKIFDIGKDIAESKDLSERYPERLQEMVSRVEGWSRSHTEPEWFHILEEGEKWRADGMPHFEETFQIK